MSLRKELEEKRRKEDLEAAYVFEEFVEEFHPTNNNSVIKTWIKAGVINSNNVLNREEKEENIIYKPVIKFKSNKNKMAEVQECARILPSIITNNRKCNKLMKSKKKSNLESFKEELEFLHKDREERQKYREELKIFSQLDSRENLLLSHDQGDPHSTNLYVNNLNVNITEINLMELFGKYGPLASVKIMWPRSDEERSRNKNCGFVAYMSRKDAERAIKFLNGKIIFDSDLRVGWGKAVLLPAFPIYIPKPLLEYLQPPPHSGLPFNAQPPNYFPNNAQSFEDILKYCVVKVVIPNDRNLIALIHRMIEFVINEGMLFEAFIMKREQHNAAFRFLFDHQSPAHVYYRWKLYSLLHGDSVREWSTTEFRMYENGPIWKPPIMLNYFEGMPDKFFEQEEKDFENMKMSLSNAQRDHLEFILHKLNPTSICIKSALLFCMTHKEASQEIAETIVQALLNNSTNIFKIISRLYLIHDLIFNSPNRKLDSYGKIFETFLPNIMEHLNQCYELLPNNHKKIFFTKIRRVFKAMMEYSFYAPDYIENLYNIFMKTKPDTVEDTNIVLEESIDDYYENNEEKMTPSPKEVETINTPTEEKKITSTSEEETSLLPGFIPSKWETVNPEIVESQAMTTSKWNLLPDTIYSSDEDYHRTKEKPHYKESKSRYSTTIKSKEISEDKRKKLREIEVKVMEYQDELEKLDAHPRYIEEKVKNYRKRLIQHYEKRRADDSRNKTRKKKTNLSGSKNGTRRSGKYDYF